MKFISDFIIIILLATIILCIKIESQRVIDAITYREPQHLSLQYDVTMGPGAILELKE